MNKEPAPGAAAGDDYPADDLDGLRAAPRYRAYLAAFFAPYVSGADVVEVGAGFGDLSRAFAQFSPRSLTLLEPSPSCLRVLQQEGVDGARIFPIKARELSESEAGRFDTAVYCNVLEHIEDDVAELKVALRLLRVGGHVVIWVPAHAWLYSHVDARIGHHRRYTQESLSRSVLEAGLQLVSIRSVNKLGIVGWGLQKIMRSKANNPWMLSLYDSFVLPWSARLDSWPPHELGLSVFAVARRGVSSP